MRTSSIARLLLVCLVAAATAGADDGDLDGDGLSDALERELIDRFVPRFRLDERECADRPAEFRADSLTPDVVARNGTLYAQVSPSRALGRDGGALELHYYHLWDRDCGRLSPHPLDVEHVSALLVPSPGGWTARYWYAAAHEDTVCDTSNAARAEPLRAEVRGPDVWVSAGKHGSFFTRALCGQRGCGVDDCDGTVPLRPIALVNLGERGHPLSGAVWTASTEWPLADKLGPDFSPELLAALDASEESVLARVNGGWRPAQFSLSVGGDVVGAASAAGRDGGESVATGERETQGALGTTFRAVGRALLGVARALGLAEDGEPK